MTRRRGLARLGIAAVVLISVASALIIKRDEPTPPPDILLDAWAPYWTLESSIPSLAAHGELLREVSPFWFSATGATDVGLNPNTSEEDANAFVASAKAQGIDVVISVVDESPGTGTMAAVLADPTTRTAHVDKLLEVARFVGADGIDIDYEQFAFVDGSSTWATTRPNWVAFIAELGAKLRAVDLSLTVSIPPIYNDEFNDDSGYWVYDYAGIEPHVDRIRIMAYDYSTGTPGPIAPMDYVRRAINGAKDAVDDHSKLVLGIALYGRNWVVNTTGTCPADAPGLEAVSQRTIDDLLARRGGTPVRDEEANEASFTYDLVVDDGTNSCTQSRVVHWVDAEGARARVDLARTSFLGGASLWALGFDDEATWVAINDLIRLPRFTVE